MPFYKEYFDNESTTQVYSRTVGGVTDTPVVHPLVRDDLVMTSFRARSHKNAYYSTEVSDISADPYAYFLEHGSEIKYKALLAERGIDAQGSPDRGHPLELSRYTLRGTSMNATCRRKSFGTSEEIYNFSNPVFSPTSSQLGISDTVLTKKALPTSDISTFAQQAYAKVAPTSVVFDAAQFLGELREGLPHIIPSVVKSGAKLYKGIGSDYLNVEFGWKPFISDLIKMGRALAGATDLLAGNGKRVHRSYRIPETYTTYEKPWGTTLYTSSMKTLMGYPGGRETAFGLPLVPTTVALGPQQTKVYYLRTTTRSQWFEGEFTNFMPLGFDPTNYFHRLNQLVNIQLTPETLWELAPWSWLVDWFLKIQSTIRANQINANDLLVMHYGYAMERTTIRELLCLDMSAVQRIIPNGATTWEVWPGLPTTAQWVATSEYKRRIRANPYGFRTGGTTALTAGQLQILGALGLTRLK